MADNLADVEEKGWEKYLKDLMAEDAKSLGENHPLSQVFRSRNPFVEEKVR